MIDGLIRILERLGSGTPRGSPPSSGLAWFFDPRNAFGTAALSLGTGLIVWSTRQLYDWHIERQKRRRTRRELALKVAIDVETRLQNLDSSAFDARAEAALVDTVRMNDAPGHPFRGYVTASIDKNSYDAFDAILHAFEPEVILAFQAFVQSDALLDKQYAGLAGDAFATLSTERKINAVKLMFESVREALTEASRLLFVLSLDRSLGRIASVIYPTDEEIERLHRFRRVEKSSFAMATRKRGKHLYGCAFR